MIFSKHRTFKAYRLFNTYPSCALLLTTVLLSFSASLHVSLDVHRFELCIDVYMYIEVETERTAVSDLYAETQVLKKKVGACTFDVAFHASALSSSLVDEITCQ